MYIWHQPVQLGRSRVWQHQVAERERSGNGAEVWERPGPAEAQRGCRRELLLLLEELRPAVAAEELEVWAAWVVGVVTEQKMRAAEAVGGTESGVLKRRGLQEEVLMEEDLRGNNRKTCLDLK